MSEYQIIRFCAPTLAGLKTASLFCCDAPDEAELLGQLRHWNTSLAPKGLRMFPLRIWKWAGAHIPLPAEGAGARPGL